MRALCLESASYGLSGRRPKTLSHGSSPSSPITLATSSQNRTHVTPIRRAQRNASTSIVSALYLSAARVGPKGDAPGKYVQTSWKHIARGTGTLLDACAWNSVASPPAVTVDDSPRDKFADSRAGRMQELDCPGAVGFAESRLARWPANAALGAPSTSESIERRAPRVVAQFGSCGKWGSFTHSFGRCEINTTQTA